MSERIERYWIVPIHVQVKFIIIILLKYRSDKHAGEMDNSSVNPLWDLIRNSRMNLSLKIRKIDVFKSGLRDLTEEKISIVVFWIADL